MSNTCNNTDRKIRVLDIINTHQCARELLDHRVAQVNATGRYENAISCGSGEFVEVLRSKGHTVYVIENPRRLSPIQLIVCIWRTYRLLRTYKFDIIHTHSSVIGLTGRLAAFMARVPIVIHQVHGFYHDELTSKFKRWIFTKAEQILSIFADKILFQNPADVEECIRQRIAPERKLVLVGNGIQIDNFKTEEEPENDPPIILYTTRMEAVKNHHMLFKAAKTLKERKVAFNIQLAGDGELMEEYEKWVRENGLDEHISFLGYREDIPALIANATVCVLLSLKEGLPRGIIEAAVSGRVMVATDVVGNRDTMIDGETGFLVPLNDAEALADKIEWLLSDAELRTRIGLQARKYALKRFDEKVVTEKIIDVYNAMAEKLK